MKRQRRIYEGKAKILYEGPEPGTYVQFFKDTATAFNGTKKENIKGKGALNNRISAYIFSKLQHLGIPTHFIKRLNMYEQLIKAVEIIPLEVVVRNIAAGSIARRFNLPEGTILPQTIIEFYYKKDELGDPLVSSEHITAFGWASAQELDDMIQYAVRINDFLIGLFAGVNITLIDFKLEFGRFWDRDMMHIILADEISPDSARLWDGTTNQKLDKDLFRQNKGGVIEAYREVARRLGILQKSEPLNSEKPTLIK